ncbi:MAG: SCP2 sterol-binding domain-containing protein [Sphingomonadales bacterium]|nr:SCP2 sterol-binding domain-containing protein [Sphingomonadales bacterium]
MTVKALLPPVPLPLPPAGKILNPLLALVMTTMRRRHGAVFDRLSGLGGKRVRIEPTSLPFAFLLTLAPTSAGARLRLADPRDMADAVIRGPLAVLLDLLEGRLDGDALFFSRLLTIEGDTEVILALRNAVDGEDIDLAADLASPFGPLAGPAAQAFGVAKTILFGRRPTS